MLFAKVWCKLFDRCPTDDDDAVAHGIANFARLQEDLADAAVGSSVLCIASNISPLFALHQTFLHSLHETVATSEQKLSNKNNRLQNNYSNFPSLQAFSLNHDAAAAVPSGNKANDPCPPYADLSFQRLFFLQRESVLFLLLTCGCAAMKG